MKNVKLVLKTKHDKLSTELLTLNDTIGSFTTLKKENCTFKVMVIIGRESAGNQHSFPHFLTMFLTLSRTEIIILPKFNVFFKSSQICHDSGILEFAKGLNEIRK